MWRPRARSPARPRDGSALSRGRTNVTARNCALARWRERKRALARPHERNCA